MSGLAQVSEFRFVYWDAEVEYRYYLVKRGHSPYRNKWAVQDGGFTSWDGIRWDPNLRGADAFRWELHEALALADKLAREMNMVIVHRMEKQFPGEFKGSRLDMAACLAPASEHVYFSTGCLHNDHEYCKSMTGLNGAKRPGTCKTCRAQCICPCHQQSGEGEGSVVDAPQGA